jgi:membrane protein DedA with SNARE-associated domain
LLGQITIILEQLITNLYVSTGLLGIVLAMAIESCCIPLPSEIVMPLAGIMLYQHKILPGTNSIVGLLLVALAGSVGCLVGSSIAYGIGYKGGRPLMLKYGRYVLISQHDADLADKFFQRWGSATAFFSRLLPIVRTYISIPAGISKMPFVKFCIYTFLGSFPFCLLLAYVGTILGDNLTKLSSVFHGLDIVVGIALVVLIALYIWHHISSDRKARAAHASQGAQEQQSQGSGQAWGQPSPPQQQFSQMGAQQNPSGWGTTQSLQPQQQQWGQQPPQSPSQFQPMQQPGWGQQPQPQQWEQQQQPQQPSQFQPAQQGWGQQPQQQQWGQQPQQPQQSMNQFQPGQQPGWGQQPQQQQQPQQPSQFQPGQQPGWGQQPQPQQWEQAQQAQSPQQQQQWGQQQPSQFQPQQQGWGQQQ